MTPTRPPTFHEKYLGGRKATDKAYNQARAHDPTEKALHGRRWQAVREMVIREQGRLCQPCQREGRITLATDVHHIKPRRTHPELMYDLDNLESVCRACHAALDAQERGRK